MAKFFFLLTVILALNFFANVSSNVVYTPKVFCYYDSRSYVKETLSKMLPSDLEPALSMCTHLVYGYAGLDHKTSKMISLKENVDLEPGHGNYKTITQLKTKFPHLKVLLSVGGGADPEGEEGTYKYNTVLENLDSRSKFIRSAAVILKTYDFDGLDLAWQFPVIKPQKKRGALGSVWHSFKKVFKTTPVDEHAEEHKEQFKHFVREMKTALVHENKLLTLSVLPNVNSSHYFDIPHIKNDLDFVILHGYDFVTPDRNPKEGDYFAPIYELPERNPELNVNFISSYWLNNAFPSAKLILGISTYGRAWKLDSRDHTTPPVETDGVGEEGPHTRHAGMYSNAEICIKLHAGKDFNLVKMEENSKYGAYAVHVPEKKNDLSLWVSYESPVTIGHKVNYVKFKGMGGVAIVDLSLDDFKGLCNGEKYPLLKAVKK